MRQILGLELSLTEALEKPPHDLVTLFAFGYRLTHTHTYTHTQTWKCHHKKIEGADSMGIHHPWDDCIINIQTNDENIEKKRKMTSCWKDLNRSRNNFEGFTKWYFVYLGKTLTSTTSKLNNLRNYLQSSTCTYCDRCNNKNRHACHDISQACRGSKSIFPVWIRPTGNLQ